MESHVFLAVLGAAALHASWNALVKNASDKFLSMIAIVAGHVPLALVALAFAPLPAPQSWPYLVAGALLHTGYQIFLLFSYRIGDLTQVYPIARGSAPLIVGVVSVLALGVVLTNSEMFAIALIGIGIMSLVLVRGADGLRNSKAAGLALATGCFIASYSIVDGLGARLAGTSLGFYAWLTILNAAIFVPLAARMQPGTLARLATNGRMLALFGGGASFIAYAIVTWAFTQAPIALVTALRETSIVFALLIGVFFLNERLNLAKLVSTVLTISGTVLLRLAR